MFDIKSALKNSTAFLDSNSLRLPDAAYALSLENDELGYILGEDSESYELLGNEFIGGTAYVGTKSDMTNLETKVKNYLNKFPMVNTFEAPFYVVWHSPNASLLLLVDISNNKTPSNENVLKLPYGTLTDDYSLEDVLDEIQMWKDAGYVTINNEEYNDTNINHLNLLKLAKEVIEWL